MLFVFNANGVPISGIPSRVFQGSNRANSIYFVCPTSPTNLVNVAFKLPNGVVTTPYVLSLENGEGLKGLCDSDQNVPYVWRAEIPSAVTQYAGTVTAQFVVTAQGGQKITTEGIEFTVEKGVPALEPEKGDSYQELLNYLANNITPPLQQLTLSIGDKVDKQTNTGQLSVYTFMGKEQSNLAVNKTPTPNTIPLFDENAKLHSTETADTDSNDTVATKGFVVGKNTEQNTQIQSNTLSIQQLQERVNSLGNVFVLKGSVPTFNDLPSGASIGDVYYVVDESVGYIWLNDGTTNRWEKFGSEGSITFTIDKEINAESTNPVENQAIAKALDNKLNKLTNVTGGTVVCQNSDGSVSGILFGTNNAAPNTMVRRTSTGAMFTGTATDPKHAINLGQVEEKLKKVNGNPFIDLPYLPDAQLTEGEYGAPTYGGLKGWKFENDNTIRIFGITNLDDYYILGRIVLWTEQGYFSILLQQAFSNFGTLGTTYPLIRGSNDAPIGTATISAQYPSGPEWTDLHIKFSDNTIVPICTQIPGELASEFSVHAMDIFNRVPMY